MLQKQVKTQFKKFDFFFKRKKLKKIRKIDYF